MASYTLETGQFYGLDATDYRGPDIRQTVEIAELDAARVSFILWEQEPAQLAAQQNGSATVPVSWLVDVLATRRAELQRDVAGI